MESDVRSGEAQRDWLQRAVALSLRRPKLTLAVWLLMGVAASIGVARIEVDTATSSFLDRGSPEWGFYQASLEQFGGDEFILVLIEGEFPFDPAALDAVRELSIQFEDLEGVRRVESIATIPSVVAGPKGTLEIAPAVQAATHSNESARQVAELVGRDRIAREELVSRDGKSFAINIRLTDEVDADRSALIRSVEKTISNMKAWHSGVPVFRAEVNRQARKELAMYVPGTLSLILLIMWIAFRSILAAFVTLASAGIGAWIVVGVMGLNGTSISLSTMTLPPIVLALGCAYATHVLAAMRKTESKGELELAVLRISSAVGFSGLTTAIGFLAMATVPIQAIRELGTFGSLGSLVVMGAALTFAPSVFSLSGASLKSGPLDGWISGPVFQRLMRWNRERSTQIISMWLALGIGFSVGIPLLHVDTDIIRWFPRGSNTRESLEAIRSRLSGITAMNAVVEGKPGKAITDPVALRAIGDLTDYVRSLEEVGATLSVTDVLDQIHAAVAVDDGESPFMSRALVEQYLSLLGSTEYLRDLISDDREAANIWIRANANGSSQILALAEKIDSWWHQNGPGDFEVGVTGIMYEYGRAEDAIAYGQLRGLGLALGAIGLILFALFRSTVSAIAALFPNILPIVIVYGAMGYLNIFLDAATVCVGSIALGIAVDDTIHIAMGWRCRGLMDAYADDAIERAMWRVLFPLIITTVSVAAGFLVLGVSNFTLIRHFGMVTASVVVLCLLADLTLLPTLLRWARRSS